MFNYSEKHNFLTGINNLFRDRDFCSWISDILTAVNCQGRDCSVIYSVTILHRNVSVGEREKESERERERERE